MCFFLYPGAQMLSKDHIHTEYLLTFDMKSNNKAELCGLSEVLADPGALTSGVAHDKFPCLSVLSEQDIAGLGDVDDPQEMTDNARYIPDCHGYKLILPDGVESRLRYVVENRVPRAEFRLATETSLARLDTELMPPLYGY